MVFVFGSDLRQQSYPELLQLRSQRFKNTNLAQPVLRSCLSSHAGDSLGYSPERIRCAAAMTGNFAVTDPVGRSARLYTVSFLRLTSVNSHNVSNP
jgi:hypothetical protein